MKTQHMLPLVVFSGLLAFNEVRAQITLDSLVEQDGSLLRYCYTVNNASANEIIGVELYGLTALDSLTSPDGWTGTAGNDGEVVNVYWLSIDPSFNIAPSTSSSTYCLLSSSRPGIVDFGILDSNFEIIFRGTTTGPLLVPEPSTQWYLIAGFCMLFAFALFKRHRRKHARSVSL